MNKKPRTFKWKLNYTANIDFETYFEMKVALSVLKGETYVLETGLCRFCKINRLFYLNNFIRREYLLFNTKYNKSNVYMDTKGFKESRIYFLQYHIEAYKDKRDLHPLAYWFNSLFK